MCTLKLIIVRAECRVLQLPSLWLLVGCVFSFIIIVAGFDFPLNASNAHSEKRSAFPVSPITIQSQRQRRGLDLERIYKLIALYHEPAPINARIFTAL
jgi:hypothetical protein